MFKFLRKHKTLVMVFLVAVIAGLPFFGLGTSILNPSASDVVMKVNGVKITAGQFDNMRNRIAQRAQDLSPQKVLLEARNSLIRQAVFYQEAKRYGITVTDQELHALIQSYAIFQKDGKFQPSMYQYVLATQLRQKPKEFEEERRREIAAQKLNELISLSVRIPDHEFADALKHRLATETDPEELKKLKENPESLRETLRKEETNLVFADWFAQINANLKVEMTSERFRKRFEQTATQ